MYYDPGCTCGRDRSRLNPYLPIWQIGTVFDGPPQAPCSRCRHLMGTVDMPPYYAK